MDKNKFGLELEKKIIELVEQCLESDALFLVDVEIKGNPGNQKIQVFIDGDVMVGIDEYSRVSRKLSGLLEEKELFDGKYTVEVSSPGVSRPLKLLRQYPKHIGRELNVITKAKQKYEGELQEVDDNSITLMEVSNKKTKKLIGLPFEDIESAKVQIRF